MTRPEKVVTGAVSIGVVSVLFRDRYQTFIDLTARYLHAFPGWATHANPTTYPHKTHARTTQRKHWPSGAGRRISARRVWLHQKPSAASPPASRTDDRRSLSRPAAARRARFSFRICFSGIGCRRGARVHVPHAHAVAQIPASPLTCQGSRARTVCCACVKAGRRG